MRPRIGITTSTLDRTPEGTLRHSNAVHQDYANCIYQAGGLPILLPTLPAQDDAVEMLATLDGLLLSGGGDIDPSYWNEPPHPALGLIDPLRDQFEIALFQEALKRDLPVFGICRGVQVMSVAAGGDIWQDIPSQCPQSIQHRQTVPRQQTGHEVAVVPNSLLAQVIWGKEAQQAHFAVNSFHHQAPRNCGIMSSVAATSPDGIIEALEIPDAAYMLGVQWHPEDLVETDERHARLFTAFVTAAQG